MSNAKEAWGNCFTYQVLSEFVQRGDITEVQAVGLAKRALFENTNRVYNLGLEPVWDK